MAKHLFESRSEAERVAHELDPATMVAQELADSMVVAKKEKKKKK